MKTKAQWKTTEETPCAFKNQGQRGRGKQMTIQYLYVLATVHTFGRMECSTTAAYYN